jgi:excisionase family DNA binding protein
MYGAPRDHACMAYDDGKRRPDFLTAQELAEVLKVAPRTVLAWHREGRIPAVQPTGSTVRFILEDVLAALKGGRP